MASGSGLDSSSGSHDGSAAEQHARAIEQAQRAEPSPSEEAAAARRFFRAFTSGELMADGQVQRFAWVVEGASGRVVGPVDGETAAADELVLHIPDESSPTLQLLLTRVSEPEGSVPAATEDRFMAYHGRPDRPRWLAAKIAAVRWHERVLDLAGLSEAEAGGAEADSGEAAGAEALGGLDVRNTLAAVELALLRRINADRGRVVSACAQRGVRTGSAVVIGLDQDGLDVRADGGVVRLEFEGGPVSASGAEGAVRAVLGG